MGVVGVVAQEGVPDWVAQIKAQFLCSLGKPSGNMADVSEKNGSFRGEIINKCAAKELSFLLAAIVQGGFAPKFQLSVSLSLRRFIFCMEDHGRHAEMTS